MNTLIIAHAFAENRITKLDNTSEVDIDAFYETAVHQYMRFNPKTKKHEPAEDTIQYVRTVAGDRFAARDAGNGKYITVAMY